MKPTLPPLRPHSGFALPSAIFLMVILAALAAFIVNVSTKQQSGHAADLQGVRAYQAARAGVEWGVFDFLRNGNCGTTSFALPGGLSGFTVTVVCSPAGMAATTNEDGTDVTVRTIIATACNQPDTGACPNNAPGVNYIERQIAVTASR